MFGQVHTISSKILYTTFRILKSSKNYLKLTNSQQLNFKIFLGATSIPNPLSLCEAPPPPHYPAISFWTGPQQAIEYFQWTMMKCSWRSLI